AEGDLVVLCPPVEHLLPLLETIAPTLRPGTLVTDVGSTKGTICAGADRLMPAGAHFVGAHPMAGSEKSGMEHARADLFAGRPCFLTPTVATDAAATERVERFWQAVGMRTLRETPARHDFTVAHVSHLPHLLASALSVALGRQNGSDAWPAVAGAGLRDTTRVAAGHPGLWRDICAQNRPALQSALGDFRHALTAFEEALEREDFDTLEALLAEGRAYRQRFDPPPA
ncbi:MAG: prephenate dehydrogenase, partial [Verrucomicrobiota bacterium]